VSEGRLLLKFSKFGIRRENNHTELMRAVPRMMMVTSKIIRGSKRCPLASNRTTSGMVQAI
jgi:hypothetical protein